jgi:Fe-S cluster biosynthesis and repair protein YggX
MADWREVQLDDDMKLAEARMAIADAKEREHLRIEFAKAALTGILASYASARAPDAIHDEVAKDAWRMAEAMVRQRFAK